MAVERWLPVPGYEGEYDVSDQGRIRSLTRVVKGPRGEDRVLTGRIRKSPPNSYGYPHVTTTRGSIAVHRAVARVFLGEPQQGQQVRHLNGDPGDNRAVNLAWGTSSENTSDQVRHGTHHCARVTHCPVGHEYTPENTGRLANGRRCLACHRAREAARRKAKV